jgi:hypothetical protein
VQPTATLPATPPSRRVRRPNSRCRCA